MRATSSDPWGTWSTANHDADCILTSDPPLSESKGERGGSPVLPMSLFYSKTETFLAMDFKFCKATRGLKQTSRTSRERVLTLVDKTSQTSVSGFLPSARSPVYIRPVRM